ncbi:MAG TPA: FtsX-like permease family protein, partial [Vicinamibacterales bacterium]|nr:FtsX-like permease family protein [Vicinamibacterales bacterium]
LAVSIVGLLVLGSGIAVLAGAIAVTRFQRMYEAAVYRTLGATTRALTAMTALEYGALGLLGGLVGSAGAMLLAWSATRFLLEVDWTPGLPTALAGVGATAALAAAVGLVASLPVLRQKPLATLRAE